MFLFEVPCVSLRCTRGFQHYSIENFIASTKTIMETHKITDGVHFVMHSFGTSFAAPIIKNMPEAISNIILIGPVPFCIHKANLTKNVLYDPVEDGRIYLMNREPHLAFTLMRTLKWMNVILWPEDLQQLKRPPTLILSGGDNFVPCSGIKSMFAEAGQDSTLSSKIIWLDNVDHAG